MKDEQRKIKYDLEERTYKFAKNVRSFLRRLHLKTNNNYEDTKQLVNSSGSIGANYIEANEALSKKDFFHRIKICRKEAKEAAYWLKLLQIDDREKGLEEERALLINESTELMKIFGAIVTKNKKVKDTKGFEN